MRKKQVGVSLPDNVIRDLEKIAASENKSVSGICSEFIYDGIKIYWAEIARERRSIFSGLNKNELIRAIQKSA